MEINRFDPGAPALPDRKWTQYEAQADDLVLLKSPPSIIEALWFKGEVLLLGGHAKSWKSWALMDLMFCIANGFEWLGWNCVLKGPVLHIDLELLASELGKRYEAIRRAYGNGNLNNITVWALRGKKFTLNDFSSLATEIQSGKYLALSFDPTYRLLSGNNMNESDPAVVTDLMNGALSVASELGCGICLLQHFSKGTQANKRALDSFSGSGVWGRAPDCCLTFREHNDERCYTLSTDLRHHLNCQPFVVQFDYPRFTIHSEKDPDELKTYAQGRKSSFDVNALCQLLENDEYVPHSSLLRRSSAAKVSASSFNRRLKDAKSAGYLAANADGLYFLTSSYLEKFRNHENNHS